jgi:hypothetical protein
VSEKYNRSPENFGFRPRLTLIINQSGDLDATTN